MQAGRTGALVGPMAAVLVLAILAAPGLFPAASADEVSLNVRYSRPVPMYQGLSCNVTVYIRNQDISRPINITWTGIHVDWLDADIYHVNETIARASPGIEVRIDVQIDVPKSARIGDHSQNFNIEYDAYEGPGLPWGHYNWQSVPVSDFKVAAASKPPTTSSSPGGLFDRPFREEICIPLAVFGFLFIIILAAAISASRRRRLRQPVPPAVKAEPAPMALPQPAYMPPPTGYMPPPPPPTPPVRYPVEQRPAGEGPAACPFCGAPNPGKHCNRCGWDVG